MLRKMISLLFCMILIISLPVTAKADIGPKPSVRITFTGIEGETYYGTLLSERRTTGPTTAWDGYEDYRDWKPENEKPSGRSLFLMRIRMATTSCRSGGIAPKAIS